VWVCGGVGVCGVVGGVVCGAAAEVGLGGWGPGAVVGNQQTCLRLAVETVGRTTTNIEVLSLPSVSGTDVLTNGEIENDSALVAPVITLTIAHHLLSGPSLPSRSHFFHHTPELGAAGPEFQWPHRLPTQQLVGPVLPAAAVAGCEPALRATAQQLVGADGTKEAADE